MKKFFSKFLKDTRGVVMMEYIILGCFAVAITLVAVLALGKTYNNGLATMAWATYGASQRAIDVQGAGEVMLKNDLEIEASKYTEALAQGIVPAANIVDFPVYTPAP